MRKRNEYYRGHYLIGIYENDEYETCITVLDNLYQFAMFYDLPVQRAADMLGKLWRGENKFLIYNHKCYKLYFIDNND